MRAAYVDVNQAEVTDGAFVQSWSFAEISGENEENYKTIEISSWSEDRYYWSPLLARKEEAFIRALWKISAMVYGWVCCKPV